MMANLNALKVNADFEMALKTVNIIEMFAYFSKDTNLEKKY